MSDNLEYIVEHFEKRKCNSCGAHFTRSGILPMSESETHVVVKVKCTACGTPLGTAIVGVDSRKRFEHVNRTLSSRDREKFSNMPPITDDEILNFSDILRRAG